MLGCLVLFRRPTKNNINLLFAFNCLVTFWWQFSWFILFNLINNSTLINFVVKVGYSGISFIPLTFFHFFVSFLNIKELKYLIKVHYLLVTSFLLLLWGSNLYINGYYNYYWGYYPKAGILHPLFVLYLSLTAGHCFLILFREGIKKNWLGNYGNNIKYLLLGLIIFTFASIDFISNYGYEIYPIGFVFICIYLLIEAIAIIKYRLIDIKIVITRASIFLFIYTLVLGVPILLGFKLLGKGLWLVPVSLMSFFAILGPFIYFFIQKKAEDRLLQEQRSYHATLRQASSGMGRIKDLNKLLDMIVFVLTRTVKIDHSVVYIYDDLRKFYKLGAYKHRSSSVVFPEGVSASASIINYLDKNHLSIIYEEIKQKSQDYKDLELISIEKIMFELQVALIVPIYIENRLIGFVGMGKKENNKVFTEDDLSVFSILANQAALAIENAEFYEDMKVTQQQLFQAEKMATIGIMADGLSHQVNNRFHAMGFIAGDALDTIKMNKNLEMSDKFKEIMSELENALNRIQENVTQGGEVVQGLLKYTRKGEEGFSPVDVDKVISSAYEMAQFKIKAYQMSLIRDYDKNTLPKVKGNSTQLQEVFFNLIDNAYDAMMQRKNDLKEQDYQAKLTIHAHVDVNSLEMIFEDNGIGVKEEDVQKLFTPFFTTKLSSKKGTGLGLYVIRKIIEDNHQGKVEFSSRYMVGTKMKIRLPIFLE